MIVRPQMRGTALVLAVISSFFAIRSEATIVEFQTVVGNFEVNLYDNATPATVTNFLDYVNNGAYTSSIVHRAAQPAGFVVQGGGFTFGLAFPPDAIPQNAPVVNEPEFSNVRGTIAMAKLGGDPNSATNQWFINVGENSAILDPQNGGFTAFGEVIGDGMQVVDAIDALQRFNFGGALGELPLLSAPVGDPDASNLVIVTNIIVTDTTVDSAAGLNPAPNTLINPPPPPPPPPAVGGGGGGGSNGALSILGLLALYVAGAIRRRCKIQSRSH